MPRLRRSSPEKRAKAEAVLARHQTPEYRTEEKALRERLDQEVRETGGITTTGGQFIKVKQSTPEERARHQEIHDRLDQIRDTSGITTSSGLLSKTQERREKQKRWVQRGQYVVEVGLSRRRFIRAVS